MELRLLLHNLHQLPHLLRLHFLVSPVSTTRTIQVQIAPLDLLTLLAAQILRRVPIHHLPAHLDQRHLDSQHVVRTVALPAAPRPNLRLPLIPAKFTHRFLQLRIAADVQIPREIAVRTHYRGNHERMERVGKLRLPREFLHLEVAKQLPPNDDRFLLHHAVQTQHLAQEFHEFKDRVC